MSSENRRKVREFLPGDVERIARVGGIAKRNSNFRKIRIIMGLNFMNRMIKY